MTAPFSNERYHKYRALYRDGVYSFAGDPPGRWFAPTEIFDGYSVYHLQLPEVGRVSVGVELSNLMLYYYDFNVLCAGGTDFAKYYFVDWRHLYYSDLWRLIQRMKEREKTVPAEGEPWAFYIAEHWAIRTLPLFEERLSPVVAF